jgi:hypothetical protein
MDDPTRRCENDTGNGTRLPGFPIPSGNPIFIYPQSSTAPAARIAAMRLPSGFHRFLAMKPVSCRRRFFPS